MMMNGAADGQNDLIDHAYPERRKCVLKRRRVKNLDDAQILGEL